MKYIYYAFNIVMTIINPSTRRRTNNFHEHIMLNGTTGDLGLLCGVVRVVDDHSELIWLERQGIPALRSINLFTCYV